MVIEVKIMVASEGGVANSSRLLEILYFDLDVITCARVKDTKWCT